MAMTLAKAMPAKPGRWMTLPLDGRMVSAQLVGDEHLHYWVTDDGLQLLEQDGCFVKADIAKMRSHALERRQKAARSRRQRVKRTPNDGVGSYTGEKRGLIILVEFSDLAFRAANDSLLYTRICNEENFSERGFHGSVHDYFLAQSYGKFDLTFDIVGPVPLSNNYKYYGSNNSDGDDARVGEMVVEACSAVDGYVDFTRYDWDEDGTVDQVMCIYAGKGEHADGGRNTIWPHEWQLSESDYGKCLYLDDVAIDTYAVSNELIGSSIDGLGTICHEFSHCLGLPDMYDTSNSPTNYGMGSWSVLDNGSYNGNGFLPASYTSFERYSCGWLQPVVLEHSMEVNAMRALADTPEAYMIVNDAWPDEYYLLENRQNTGWDAGLPGSGMLILHVDYDPAIWEYNFVNTFNKNPEDMEPANDHQRCTVFKANPSSTLYSKQGQMAYPYLKNDSLTSTSRPAASIYNKNADGTKLMNKSVLGITRNDDGTMAFRFRNDKDEELTAVVSSISHGTYNGGDCYTPAGCLVGKATGRLRPGLYIQRDNTGQRSRTVIIK